MNIQDFKWCCNEVKKLMVARYHLIFLRTPEEDRGIQCVVKAYEDILKEVPTIQADRSGIFRWGVFEGLQHRKQDKDSATWEGVNGTTNTQRPVDTVLEYLNRNMRSFNNNIQNTYIFPDWPSFITSDSSENQVVIARRLQELVLGLERMIPRPRTTLVIIGRDWNIPSLLRNSVYVLDLPLPTENELLENIFEPVQKKFSLPNDEVNRLKAQAQGMTHQAVQQAVRLIGTQNLWSEHDTASTLLLEVKKQEIRKTGVLDYFAAQGRGLDEVGGLGDLKEWLTKRAPWFSQDEEPDMRPRAVLLEGFPGCGKTFIARRLAEEWRVPQISFEISRLQNRYVGETESNTYQALRAIEASAPNILFMDEIEKAFAGVGGDSSGVTTRQFGAFLTWLNDHKYPVFFIATSNDRSKLPAELFRAGRFDEIFIIMPPNSQERKEILKQRMQSYKIDITSLEERCLTELIDNTRGFSGAELDKLVKEARYVAGLGSIPSEKDWFVACKGIKPQYRSEQMQRLLRSYSVSLKNGAGVAASPKEEGFLESLLMDKFEQS